jgi:hypothetical protein
LKLFTYLFDEEPKLRVLKNMSDKKVRVLKGNRVFSPAFAVVDGWLTLTTTERMLSRIVAVSVGQEPSIQDVPGFKDKVIKDKNPWYLLSYLDCALLFEDMKTYSLSLLERSDRYDNATLEETVGPFWEALKKAGKMGGALTLGAKGLTGSVVPL